MILYTAPLYLVKYDTKHLYKYEEEVNIDMKN